MADEKPRRPRIYLYDDADYDHRRIYYVYRWLRPDGTPFYIGKGKGNRKNWGLVAAITKREFKNIRLGKLCRKLVRENGEFIIEVVRNKLTEAEAYDSEAELIAKFGRGSNGLLVNLQPGGRGGLVRESAAKIVAKRRAADNYRQSPESYAKMVATRRARGNYLQTPETIAKQRATKVRNNTLFSPRMAEVFEQGRRSKEAHQKVMKVRKERHGDIWTPDQRQKASATRRARGSYHQSPESYAQMVETRRARGNYVRTPEAVAKGIETRRRRKQEELQNG